jgi:hypothetical protein
MTTFAWFARRKAESETTFELEEFLRTVALMEDNKPAPPRQPVPPAPPRPGLDERLDEALVETFPASDPIAVSAAS